MMQSLTLLLGAPCPSAICGPIFLGSPPARPLLPILQPERLPHHRLRIHSVCWQWKHTPCASDTGSRKVIFFAQRFYASLSKRDDIKLCHWVPKGSIFLKIDQNQLSFLFGFYLKKERKKIERKKVRARPLCHPRQPTHEPFRFIGHINASVP